MLILSAKEINKLIMNGIIDAKQELQDSGLILAVEHTSKNSDNVTLKNIVKESTKTNTIKPIF